MKRTLPVLGTRLVVQLRPSEVKTFRRVLAARLAPTTTEQTMAILAMVLRAAVHDGLIDRSPLPPAQATDVPTRMSSEA